jgi:hypothetical protein
MQVLIVNHLLRNSSHGYSYSSRNRNTNRNYSFDAFNDGNLFKSVNYKTTQPTTKTSTTKTPYYKIIKQEANESTKDYVIRIHNSVCYEMINYMGPQEINALSPYCYILNPDIVVSYCNYKVFRQLVKSGLLSNAKYYIERKSNYSREDIYMILEEDTIDEITKQICYSKLLKMPKEEPKEEPKQEPKEEPKEEQKEEPKDGFFKKIYKKFFCPSNKIESSESLKELTKPLINNSIEESFKFDFK